LPDNADGVPEDVWSEVCKHFDATGQVALTLAIASINAFSRIHVINQTPVGTNRSAAGGASCALPAAPTASWSGAQPCGASGEGVRGLLSRVRWPSCPPAGRCASGRMDGRPLGGPECDRELLVVSPDSARYWNTRRDCPDLHQATGTERPQL